MRILHIDAGRGMRGGQWQVLRLVEGLLASGVDTSLAAPPEAPLYRIARERGLPVRPLGFSALTQCADLVHAHDARSHALAVALARAPVVVSRRVAFPIRDGLLSRWKYRSAAHFVAVSHFVRDGMVERGIPAGKISVVYDGVPLLEESAHTGPVLAPPPSSDKPAAWYEETGLEFSFAANLADDLKTASIFVYISACEGLGSAVLLAMAAAVPVVATATGGISEIIRDQENGLLVERAPAALAAAVRRLQTDRDLAKMLATRGRETITQKFSIDNMVSHTLAIYRRVLSC
jgi:glycosyltransferase involved in cell wall biosynthesis